MPTLSQITLFEGDRSSECVVSQVRAAGGLRSQSAATSLPTTASRIFSLVRRGETSSAETVMAKAETVAGALVAATTATSGHSPGAPPPSPSSTTPGTTSPAGAMATAGSARWAKLRADPALQRSAALRARLARRERRNRQRILRLQEFHRLRSMVPTIAHSPNVDKVTVIEEAIKYIDHLHEALRNKFTERGLPPALQGLPIDLQTTDMRTVVRLLASDTVAASAGTSSSTFSGDASSSSNSSTSAAPTTRAFLSGVDRDSQRASRAATINGRAGASAEISRATVTGASTGTMVGALPPAPPAGCIPHPCERQRHLPSYLFKTRGPRKFER